MFEGIRPQASVLNDRGDSLVEILAAVAVLGIGIVGLMTALATHASTTGINRDQAQASTLLLTSAEYVKSLAYTGTAGSCTPISATAISQAALPHDTAYTLTYGPGQQLDGSTTCDMLEVVPVTVTGNGFTLTTDVVKRP